MPVTTVTYLLAVMLTLTATVALALLWWLYVIRRDAGLVRQQLAQQQKEVVELRNAEQAARRGEQNLQEITARVPVLMFTVHRGSDRRYRLPFLTGDLPALFGLDPAALQTADGGLQVGPLLDRVHHEDREDIGKLLRKAVRSQRSRTVDFRAYGKDGLRWVHLVLASRRRPRGEVHWTGYCIDTTGINTRNEALRAARDAAERASKAKADFLATMSHEIRTPMSGVIGMLELLGHTRLDPEQQELLRTVEDSAGVLLQILNDVLDFSKLESGNLRLDPAPFDLRRLIDNVVGMVAPEFHRSGVKIRVATDAALAGILQGDSVRLHQVLLNLLSNASKFTAHGEVAVSLRVLGDDGVSQRLRLSVADTGIGIPAEKQAQLFTPFTQAESSTTRRFGGTGLGLAICRHLVELMDGEIQLDSRPGVGTTITVEVQLPIGSREVERPPGLEGRHAIVRLRSPETAAALAGTLQTLGLTVERIPPTTALRPGLAANLLFVDAGDHGSAATVAARIIGVDDGTATADDAEPPEDDIRLDANPLSWKGVVRACVQGLAAVNQQSVSSSPAVRPAPAAMSMPDVDVRPQARAQGRQHRGNGDPDHRRGRILIAEDHPVSQMLVQRQLDLLGWPCDIVGDGQAAYDALKEKDYAMLITDCRMPRMDGYELATAWRRHEAERGDKVRLPIIAMTASALDGELARCRAAGMDDFLGKPVQLRQLGDRIDAWVPDLQPPAPDPVADVPAVPASGGDGPTAEMLQLMLDTGRTDLQRLDQAIASHDADGAAQQLHRVLGALQLFSDGPEVDEGRRWLEQLEAGNATRVLQQLPAHVLDLRRLLVELTGSQTTKGI